MVIIEGVDDINDIAGNDIAINDIAINDIAINDIAINDIAINDIVLLCSMIRVPANHWFLHVTEVLTLVSGLW